MVHLVGVAHPSPAKAKQFVDVDLKAATASIDAAHRARIEHLVFVSVAQPAPVMRAYIEVRARCEAMIREAALNATVLRPWYVLGPGHRWPAALIPFYKLAEKIPSMSEGARRLGLVRLGEMVAALACAVENPASGFRIVDVPGIRANAKLLA